MIRFQPPTTGHYDRLPVAYMTAVGKHKIIAKKATEVKPVAFFARKDY